MLIQLFLIAKVLKTRTKSFPQTCGLTQNQTELSVLKSIANGTCRHLINEIGTSVQNFNSVPRQTSQQLARVPYASLIFIKKLKNKKPNR